MKNSILIITCLVCLSACASATRYLLAESYMYRQLHLDTWAESGGDEAVMENTLANIKAANANATKNIDLATQEYSSGNWHYEWDSVANDAAERGDHFAASAYFTISAYPFIKDNEWSNRSYKKALYHYQKAVQSDGTYIEQISIPTSKGIAYAYLHLPEQVPDAPLPVLVVTNGSDHTLTTLYNVYSDYLKPNGWAMVSFDLPGIASNAHIGISTSQTNLIHQQLLQQLQQEKRVNSSQIALMGSSFGGNAVTKTAFTNEKEVAAAVNICGAVNTPFTKLKFALTQVPQMTGDAFLSRFDMTREQIIKTSEELALSTHYLGKVKTTVPILSINHDDDSISPPRDMQLVAESSVNGKYIVVDKGTESGHCASDDIALPLAMQWLQQVVLPQ